LHGAEVHAGVFPGPVGVGGKDGGWMDALDSDPHPAMITS
jgi:hypothetical protein